MAKKEVTKPPQMLFCEAHRGGQVFVGGMWTGDFVGAVVGISFTDATFRVDKPLGDKRRSEVPKPGALITLSYSSCMKLREATEAERQITISEAVGDIEIK